MAPGQKPADWISTSAGTHLRGRTTRNTRPERVLRSALHSSGYRFRLHRKLAPACTPDIVLPRHRIAIFVDGCFFHGHGCPTHGRQKPFAGPNAALWEEKITRNRERDQRATETATSMGWRVIRIWECEIISSPDLAVKRVHALTRARVHSR